MNFSEESIYPWKVYFDQSWKRNYYYNLETGESVWTLPNEILSKISNSENTCQKKPLMHKGNLHKFPPIEKVPIQRETLEENYLSSLKRPARIQRIKQEVSYKQGAEHYNIWYDKYISENSHKKVERAEFRCDPENDNGYTKANIFDKDSAYFCIYFAHGECTEGHNCKFLHSVPILSQCNDIPNEKDVFGRPRFAEHRDDRAGIGSFLADNSTLYIRGFQLPKSQDAVKIIFENLYRHFSPFGEIEEIVINEKKVIAFLKFSHRCMAEFAKEAMTGQSLDHSENLVIRWGNNNTSDSSLKRKALESLDDSMGKKIVKVNESPNEKLKTAFMLASVNNEKMDEPLSFSGV